MLSFCLPHCTPGPVYRRPASVFAVDFEGPALPHGVELSGNIFDMLGRLNLSSLHSNVQHLASTLSGHSPSLLADALCSQPTHVSYSRHEPRLDVSIGTSSSSFPRAVHLRGQAYISRGWAASRVQLNDGQAQVASSSKVNMPLLDRVRQQSPSFSGVLLALALFAELSRPYLISTKTSRLLAFTWKFGHHSTTALPKLPCRCQPQRPE